MHVGDVLQAELPVTGYGFLLLPFGVSRLFIVLIVYFLMILFGEGGGWGVLSAAWRW